MKSKHCLILHSALLLALASPVSWAQAVYKIVGPDGKVTFSDKPPASAQQGKLASAGAAGESSANAELPYALRQATAKYPVTLYTGSACSPCDAARSFLKSRGVPFSERTVSTQADADALQRLAGESTLPFGTIGSQKLKGFNPTEWAQYLDAADYPSSSMLLRTYHFPAASPLVAVQKTTAAAKEAAPPAATSPAPSTAPSNPAGITF